MPSLTWKEHEELYGNPRGDGDGTWRWVLGGIFGIIVMPLLFSAMCFGPPHDTRSKEEGINYRDNRRMEEVYRTKRREDVTGWDTEKDWTLWDAKNRRVR